MLLYIWVGIGNLSVVIDPFESLQIGVQVFARSNGICVGCCCCLRVRIHVGHNWHWGCCRWGWRRCRGSRRRGENRWEGRCAIRRCCCLDNGLVTNDAIIDILLSGLELQLSIAEWVVTCDGAPIIGGLGRKHLFVGCCLLAEGAQVNSLWWMSRNRLTRHRSDDGEGINGGWLFSCRLLFLI